MSWVSKQTKSVSKAGSGVLKSYSGGLSSLLGIGGTPGPENPYGKPDLSYLNDTSKLDFLKNPDMYKSLLDTSGYDFLKKTSAPVKSFASTYQKPTGSSDLAFNDLMGNINAPSSVDAVNGELDNDRLKQLMEGIDIDTRNTVGSLKSDFADRGLGGPGMISDMEGNALAQAYGDANRTRAGARTELAQKELERLKAREDAARTAYGSRYSNKAAEDTQDRSIAAQGAITDIGSEEAAANRTNQNGLTFASLLDSGKKAYADSTGAASNLFAQLLNARDLGAAGINSTNYNNAVENQYKYAKPGILETLLGNTKINLGF